MPISINGSGTVTGISVGGLPDGIVDNDMIANSTIAEAKLAANVNTITMVDQWRRTANVGLNNSENFLTTDWERVDSSGQGYITGSGGMTESGGIFTFPSTGIYKVEWQGYFEDTGSADTVTVGIMITTDNSSYNRRANMIGSVNDVSGSTYAYDFVHTQTLVDVTDTSQVKVKFRVSSGGSVSFDSSSSENRNCATFIRFGDT